MSQHEPQRWDFDALYRGESPAEGVPAVTSVPWDSKAPKESVVAWSAPAGRSPSLEPVTVRRPGDGPDAVMALWLVAAQRATVDSAR